jgi:hypothetical protein
VSLGGNCQRAAWADRPEDAALGEMVEELTSQSTEFAQLWPKRCVRVNGRGLRPLLQHPRVGPLTVEHDVLTSLQDRDQRVIIYRAADTTSQAAIDVIARGVERSPLHVQQPAGSSDVERELLGRDRG